MMAGLRVMCIPCIALLVPVALGQQVGELQAEVHPMIWTQTCDDSRCRWERNELTLDANWRWANSGGENCYTDESTWDPTFCPNGLDCALSCSLEGADYASSYGISTTSWYDGVKLNFVTEGEYGNNYGSRLYLMDSEDTYKMFRLKNREFAIDVDVSKLPCGLNGAVYFVEMDSKGDWNGGSNKAGAKYGTGYCDAQCPHDIKYIKGEVNSEGWDSENIPPVGHYGACCAEMDIWEANKMSTAYTPHPCARPGLVKCEGVACGDTATGERYEGLCDKDGCDYNHYRMGDYSYYGPGPEYAVDTTKLMTVVTQFITEDGTDDGDLVEIRRFYVQDGTVIPNSESKILSDGTEETAFSSVTDDFCAVQKDIFGDNPDFATKGGLREMGDALGRGMVLVISLWDDSDVNMLWLDSMFPEDEPPRKPGVARGPCPPGPMNSPDFLREAVPDSSATFSNIKVGTIGSTTAGVERRMDATLV